MIFTRNSLSQILSLENITDAMLCSTLNKIGLEVESFCVRVAPKRVVVGKILECQKHPDATKLNVAQVAIGGKEGAYAMRQIVCGAQNAREGIYVAVALEGAELPDITIKKAMLRGVESCGMLCSTTELGFPKVNDGIVELDSSIGELVIGKELSEYPVFNDAVYEISITPNRGDCMSLMGVARDLSVAFELELKPLNPSKVSENAPGIGRVLQIVANDKHDASLLFQAMETKPSVLPLCVNLFLAYNGILENAWLKDAINFSTLFSGVILNAYPQSFCQLDGQKVILTLKKDAQGFESIYHENEKLSTIGVDLCTYASKESFVKEKEFIVLEASYIPPEIIAQKAMETKVKVDVKVFQRTSRGSSPDLAAGLSVLSSLLLGEEGVLYTDAQELIEVQPKNPITIDLELMAHIIGVRLEKLKVVNILKGLGFGVEISSDENFIIAKPPLFRHDIVGLQDVAEEVIRFYGIDNVPSVPLVFAQNFQSNTASREYYFRRKIAQKAIGAGFNEALHFVFEDREKLQGYGFAVLDDALDLLNPITQDLNTLRSTLLLGLLRAVERNCKNGFNAVSLFEMGAVYDKKRKEGMRLAFVQSGLLCEERFPNAKGVKGSYFGFCDRIACVIGGFSLEPLESKIKLFHSGQCAKMIQNGKEIGLIATLHPQVASEFGLEETYLCELNMESLREEIPQVQMYSKFQKTQRDLSVVLDKSIPYYKVRSCIEGLKVPSVVGFYPLDLYQDSTLQDRISLTIRFTLQSSVKTLEEKDINAAMEIVLEGLKKAFGAELRCS
ncbi:phenylalanine--tRNA ligase subunit beta [Helicobacter sp.]|uniref:phenylalanine--tRNA ligase subunit beta n=1 Tax=Helicobacter sp. TaxID=218 RepID=UPI0025C349D4|nr:phenylalanine--tRNA ligase subunit beta [Helicobacter sp.]MCI5968384.1 phenylalanine--tRNA ligase subunit beta [Helicobacter sp.]MDY2585169.1 phenylalanine--tRNA ligase subunit beta [Helicobacter sp.]